MPRPELAMLLDVPHRKKLPENRDGLTAYVKACQMKFYITCNWFDDGTPAEIFVKISKQGSTLSGLVQALVVTISLALQYGVPWEALSRKYRGTNFPPHDDANSSIVHAIASAIDRMVEQKRKEVAK